MESTEEESDESKDDLWSMEGEHEQANLEDDNIESEDEAPHLFPQFAPTAAPAPAPLGRTAQSPSLRPNASSEGRVALPAPRSTSGSSGGRATPVTVSSVKEGSGSVELVGSGVSVMQTSVIKAQVIDKTSR